MKVGIAGCKGRVGSLLVQELQSGHWKGLQLSGGTVRIDESNEADFLITNKPADLFKVCDVVIDFTIPAATREHIRLAAQHGTALIIGTTGLNEEDEAALREAAKKARIVYSANMSLGVNLLMALVEQAAAKLGPDWDIEIFEAHHKNKVDAPSGTALALGKAAAKGRCQANFAAIDRNGKRKPGEIGYAVTRGGDVVGEHTVYFYGEGERIELSHVATNRALFAKGALKAAQWIGGQKPGLYSLRDVLGV